MNAARLRREDKAHTAEEKRQLLRFAQEEREKRDTQIVADFKELISEKIKKPAEPAPEDR
jgi:hypothetical protein